MKLNYEIELEQVFLEELTLSKLEETEMKVEELLVEDKEQNTASIEISGKVLSNKDNDEFFKYILIITFKIEGEFKLSIIYDSYFNVKNISKDNFDEDELSDEFNYYLWPFAMEQISNITSKMKLDRKIIIPTLGVILNGK